MTQNSQTDAFRVGPRVLVEGSPKGPLVGLKFAVKDIIDVVGHCSGVGVPQWLAAQSPALTNAPVVQLLVDAGASVIGKTHLDEFAYALTGENSHYGTPTNPAAPNHVPGGSSSGSASAVAAGLCDFALGTDTAGSIRVPASYCGLIGVRPAHGSVCSQGVVPLAQRFDTVGWLAAKSKVSDLVGNVLLKEQPSKPETLYWAEDYFDLLPSGADVTSLRAGAEELAADLDVAIVDVVLGHRLQHPDELVSVFRAAQSFQAWQNHGAWVDAHAGELSPAIAARFVLAKRQVATSVERADAIGLELRGRIENILDGTGRLLLPSAAGPAPVARDRLAEQFRHATMQFSVLAPLSMLPQVSLPVAHSHGLPLGLGLLG
ncbi:MAG: amidase family protein [Acidimicrobiales bacterium]